LKIGKDFFLAFSPERVDPGNPKYKTKDITKIVGGVTPECTELGRLLYSQAIKEVIPVSSTRSAEMVKLLENTFRSVNIAMVNELALMCHKMGLDVWEIINAAKTKPFGFMPFYPGPGVGGTCIPKDPYYLIERAREKGFEHRFVSLARSLNNAMPVYAVSLVEQLLASLGKPVETAHLALLGLSYKADVDDVRESPALEILRLLSAKNKSLKAFDPFVPGKSNVRSLEEAVQGADCVLLATNHRSFVKSLSPRQLKAWNVKAVFDARNALDKEGILAAGIRYKGIGR
ncbi:MAG TPA: nucleotide sugar dehydrogenase, partial [Candidatus Diapherotrites archaeon]|nr:nucleotide sugar dehydrogenase [Candidatus Diapherotrites archaeon]